MIITTIFAPPLFRQAPTPMGSNGGIRVGVNDKYAQDLTLHTVPYHDVSRAAFDLAPMTAIPQVAALGHDARMTGSSVCATIRPSSTLAAAVRVLTRGMTLCRSFFTEATRSTKCMMSLSVAPLGVPGSAASCETMSCQRCWPSDGGSATVSSICRYVHPAGACFCRRWLHL